MTSLRKSTVRCLAAGLFALVLASSPAWAEENPSPTGGATAAVIGASGASETSEASGAADSEVSRFLETLANPAARPAATDHQCTEPPCETDGDGSSTCAVRCADGSWSSIGCNDNEVAHCTCGGYPVMANPYCTRKW